MSGLLRCRARPARAVWLALLLLGAGCAQGSATGPERSMQADLSSASSAVSPGPSIAASPGRSAIASIGASAGASPGASPGDVSSLPAGFPVPPGAMEVPVLSGNPALVARWTCAQNGARVYDYLLAELPAAGFRILGRYPGGGAAALRVASGDGKSWLITIRAAEPVVIELWLEEG